LATEEQVSNTVVCLLLNAAEGPFNCTIHAALYQHWQAQLRSHEAVTQVAYSFIASLQQHSQKNELLTLTAKALQGDVPAQALWHLAEVLAAVRRVVTGALGLPRSAMPSPEMLHHKEAQELLHRLLPNRTDEQLHALCGSTMTLRPVDGAGNFSCAGALRLVKDDLVSAAIAEGMCDTQSGVCASRASPEQCAGDWGGEVAQISDGEGQQRVQRSEPARGEQATAVHVEENHQLCSTSQGIMPARREMQADNAEPRVGGKPFLVLVAEQHAQQLLHLDTVVCEALTDIMHRGTEGVGITKLDLTERLSNLETLCQDVCAFVLLPQACCGGVLSHDGTGSEQAAPLVPHHLLRMGLKDGALLQCKGDCDEQAAWAWLKSLQCKAQGHESSASLPEVA
jgi:hypothetical protein